MREIVLNRQLLGLEDLLFGVGIVTQIRAGQSVNVTRINAGNLPFDETQSLLEWAQSVNLDILGSMTTELQAIYDNLIVIGNVEDNLVVINSLEDNLLVLQSLHTNMTKLQNIDTNMTKLQNIDTNMTKLQNIDTNMTKLQAIYTDLTKLESIYDNLTMLLAIYNNLATLNNINSQVIPNLTELLLVNDNAAQVAADKLTVATDKSIVAGYKDDVSSMKVAVESIYDTFDDRFLGVKTSDPILDNDGNTLQDGAMYFNGSSNALKVYSLDNTTWYTIPQIYLSGLLDVNLTSITTGDILTWNGTKWVNTRTPSFDSVKLNGGTGTQGTATWNNIELTYDLVLNDNVTLQVGQEEVVYCKNNTLTTIPNGKPVMAVGTNGNSGNILVDLHDGTKASAKRIIGLTTQSILPSNNVNPYGFVTRNGKVRGLNTTGSDYGETWVDGDILYVKATGALTKVEPADTALKMPIAFVIHAHTNGTLYVRTTGIDENHDRDLISTKVTKVTSTDNAVVRFDETTGQVQNSGVVIDDSNNVGVGTSSPKDKIHSTGGIITTGSYSGISNGGSTIMGYNGGIGYVYALDPTIAWKPMELGALSFDIKTSGTSRVIVDSAGNLTINSGALRGSHGGGNIATNFAAGDGALLSNTSGYNNTANGVSALLSNTTGNYNTANGVDALVYNTTGANNTATGVKALQNNITGDSNTANGVNALRYNTTGYSNTANGVNTLLSNTTGNSNTANGVDALKYNTTGYSNTANGVSALVSNTTGFSNTANGVNALALNTTGNSNTANGVAALYNNTTGTSNTANGLNALFYNTTGGSNTANGVSALLSNTTGNYNTASGVSALANNTTFSNVSGLGYNSQVTGSNQIQLGDAATTTYVYGTVQNRSDLRDKADVRDTVLGLDFIKSLRPVDYKWDMREDYKTERPVAPDIEKPSEDDIEALAEYNRIQDEYKLEVEKWLEDNKLENIVKDGSKKRARYHQGFIAQEVQALGVEFGGIQDHSIKGGEDVLSIGYDEIIAPLVKAIQEMSIKMDTMQLKINELKGAK